MNQELNNMTNKGGGFPVYHDHQTQYLLGKSDLQILDSEL